MGALRFGTDGVRGRAFDELTLVDAHRIGLAAAEVLGAPSAVIGRDTRESGPAIVAAVAAGLHAGGVEALDLGVVPTPGVAHVASRRQATGVMVSASHNPWHDNGIKLFAANGSKLSDTEQAEIEGRLGELAELPVVPELEAHPPLVSIQHELADWVETVKSTATTPLDGLTLVLDAANGAGSHLVAPALADLGATVTALFNEPDGRNINDGCGSTAPQRLAETVVELGADFGVALDGDADRLVTVDHNGRIVDGDHLMAMLAVDMHQRASLPADTLVVTVMSNLGLLRAMDSAGISVEVTPVGDRHVLDALERLGAGFGGEQSGHLIFREHAATGDGFLSAVQVAALVCRHGQPLAQLADAAMTSFPQVLRSVPVHRRMPDVAAQIAAQIAVAENRLGLDGRVLVRASGTEPVVRVMVEAADEATASAVCDDLCLAVGELSSTP